MSSGLRLLGSLSQVQDLSRFDLSEELFLDGKEAAAFNFIKSFAIQYGCLPTEEALSGAGIDLYPSQEPPEYHYDKMRERFTHTTMKRSLTEASELANSKLYDEARDLLMTMCVDLARAQNPNKIVNFVEQGHEQIITNYKATKSEGQKGVNLGWHTPDSMAGGLVGGDVATIVGRPGAGKTFLMLFAAISAWLQNKIPLVVSMEMKPLPIMQRLIAMMSSLPISDLMSGDLPTALEQKMANGLQELTGKHPFWLIDGSLSSTVEEICLQTQQYKPDIVFIDAAYLLRHPNQKMSRWDRATENMELMKSILAEDLDVPVVNSHQLNRDAEKKIKKGKKDELGVEDIAYTDAVGQISSLVMALLQQENANDVEIIKQREVTIMKGRNGESGSFNINWEFQQGPNWLDFSEIEQVQLENLSYE